MGHIAPPLALDGLLTLDPEGAAPILASEKRCLGPRQTAFDAEVGAIEATLQ